MFLHDVSDILLESAKCFNYAKNEQGANLIFGAFVAVFIGTRNYLYPKMVLYTSLYDIYRVIFSIGHNVLKKFLVIFLLAPAYTPGASPTEWDILFAVLNAEKDARTIVNR